MKSEAASAVARPNPPSRTEIDSASGPEAASAADPEGASEPEPDEASEPEEAAGPDVGRWSARGVGVANPPGRGEFTHTETRSD